MKALASHRCGPGSIPGPGVTCGQGSILAFFQTRQPGKYVTKDTCPDKILLARAKLRNN